MFSPASCLGSQALTLTCAGGVVSKVNLWTIFLEPPKRPCTSKGIWSLLCALQASLSILHESTTFWKRKEAQTQSTLPVCGPKCGPSTCSPHGFFPWFSGIKPSRHAPGSSITQWWLQSCSPQPSVQHTMGSLVEATSCPSSCPPRGSPHELWLQSQGEPCWATPPQKPAQDTFWGWIGSPMWALWHHAQKATSFASTSIGGREFQLRIPPPERRKNKEQNLRLETLLPSILLELIQFPTSSYGDQQEMS